MKTKNYIALNEALPLQAQLHDGAPDVKVTGVIFDPIGTLIASVELGHIASGLYVSGNFKMPNVEFVRVQYLTDRPNDYEIVSELFYLAPIEDPAKHYHIGEVVKTVKNFNIVEGELLYEGNSF